MAAVGETEAGDWEEWIEVVAGGEVPPQATAQRWSWGVLRDGAGKLVGRDGREHGP